MGSRASILHSAVSVSMKTPVRPIPALSVLHGMYTYTDRIFANAKFCTKAMSGNRTFNALPQLFHCLHKSQEIHLASQNPCKCETKGSPSSTVPKQPHLERSFEVINHKTCDITWRFWRILAVRLPPYTAIASLLRYKPMRHS